MAAGVFHLHIFDRGADFSVSFVGWVEFCQVKCEAAVQGKNDLIEICRCCIEVRYHEIAGQRKRCLVERNVSSDGEWYIYIFFTNDIRENGVFRASDQ